MSLIQLLAVDDDVLSNLIQIERECVEHAITI